MFFCVCFLHHLLFYNDPDYPTPPHFSEFCWKLFFFFLLSLLCLNMLCLLLYFLFFYWLLEHCYFLFLFIFSVFYPFKSVHWPSKWHYYYLSFFFSKVLVFEVRDVHDVFNFRFFFSSSSNEAFKLRKKKKNALFSPLVSSIFFFVCLFLFLSRKKKKELSRSNALVVFFFFFFFFFFLFWCFDYPK